ncbi:MAG TPA: DUF5686 and carboxypeptidase regulatory-like domain-containing protein [Mucilaginibacter sp.]|nr:DUF5686 and carboxypeptidase regulatory-like domain-containing protein [Mucilaginibacter sp.]
MRKYLLILLMGACSLAASAQDTFLLTGRITGLNGKPLSFAAVYIKNSTYGTNANEQGSYQLKLDPGTYDVIYRFVGYKELTEHITIGNADVQHNVQMTDEQYALRKFSRIKGQPVDSAVGIIRQVIAKRQYFLKQVDSFSCVAYIKGVQKLISAPKALMSPNVSNALSVDSTGKGILYQTESISNFAFKQPDKFKEVMVSSITAGRNAAFSFDKASDLSANFYKDIFMIPGLASRGFISPFAGDAPEYYTYNLVGSKIENGLVVHKIQVSPKHKYDRVFTGYVYIVDGDWRIYSVNLMLTGKQNSLNLVDTLQISQEYVPIRDSVWEPLSIQYNFNGDVLGFKFEGYYLGIYNNYKLNPEFPDNYFNGERMRVDSSANNRNLAAWQELRPVPLTAQENKDYANKAEIAAMNQALEQAGVTEASGNHFNIIPYIPFGYKLSFKHHRDSIYVDPFLQTVFYNTVEGGGINLRGTFVHYLDTLRTYSITPNLRYGFTDKTLYANIRGEYDYDPLNRGKFFAGFGKNILDLNNVGTRSVYFNTLSTLLSARNYVKYYSSEYIDFGFQRNLNDNLLLKADISYANRTQLYNNTLYTFKHTKDSHLTSNNPLMPDAPANEKSELFPQNQALTLTGSLTYTFDQQYITRPRGREFLPSKYPQITLTYRQGINGLLGSDVNYNFASLSVYHEHLDAGLWGFSAFKIEAGDFFNHSSVYFMDYNHFKGNQGTTIDPTPGSYHFLPFYTYSTDGPYFEGHFEHNFAGHFFNRIPLLRRLKLDEIAGVNFLTTNDNRNYTEFYVGIQRFIFRLDYGVSFEGSHKFLQGFRIFYGIK